MPDIGDKANEAADLLLSAALRNSKRGEDGPPPCGFCHNCGTRVPSGARWCDSDCRDDWNKYNKR